MKNLFIVFLWLIPLSTFAQDYMPCVVEGNYWQVQAPHGVATSLNYFVDCDTIINELTYSILRGSLSGTILGFAREDIDAQNVYWWDVDSTEESLYFSFDVEPGDVVDFYWGPLTVDSIKYEESFGKVRKVIYLGSAIRFIEGVGMNFYGIVFYDDYAHLWNFEEEKYACGYVYSPPENADESFEIFPNPSSGYLEIKMVHGYEEDIKIFSAAGVLVYQGTIRNRTLIHNSKWAKGLYFLVRDGHEVIKIAKL